MKQTSKVPYLDLSKSYKLIRPQLEVAFSRVIESGRVVLGNELTHFEKEYAHFSSVKYAIGVGNGLDALTIALKALSVKEGDEVIVPSNTFVATLIAVSRVGATPVIADVKNDTYNINPEELDKVVSKRTKVIMPVHLYGQACEMDKIMSIAKKHKLFVVEDNAQSQGATFKGKITGSFGDVNATSFYPGKNVGALGDAGGITTNVNKYQNLSVMFRNYGENVRYYNKFIGFNSRLDELQAAFLRIRLKQIPTMTSKKQKIASTYLKELDGVGDLILPLTSKNATHVYHVFCVRTNRRDELKDFLERKGVTTLIHYPVPVHLQEAYRFLGYKQGDFPISEEISRTTLSLPIFPEMNSSQIELVISSTKKFFKQHA
jgi:dTDP-4-amino-4,6-dideoxygalactose transaminase